MEYPDLGEHCSMETCKRLDFLPVKCDACQKIFCSNHMSYMKHNCPSAYKKNVQVPVCPLCNKPVPTERGVSPDVTVGNHIDNFCQSDRAHKKKIFTNKCSMNGCKTKEIVPVLCNQCRLNFCFKHRHTTDHHCSGPKNRAAEAALLRQKQNANGTARNRSSCVSDIQGTMSEDEALARALQLSEQDANSGYHSNSRNRQSNCRLS